MNVRMVVYSTVRENHEEGRDEMRVMWSPKCLGTLTYLKEVFVDVRVELSGGNRETRKDDMPKCLDRRDGPGKGGAYKTHEGLCLTEAVEPMVRGRKYNRRTCAEDRGLYPGRTVGTTTSFDKLATVGRG